ncbi:MAG: DUF1836 domain-containing protein [Brotaphodocola sp.]
MKKNDERLSDILKRLDDVTYVKQDKIPDIDLYMDQVTSFMEEHLKKLKRNPDDKALTKTMINNYAKNNLIPSPIKKKYSKDHILLLLFIYYYKNMLSFNDIEQLFQPLTAHHFGPEAELPLSTVYEEIFSLEQEQLERLKDDIQFKFKASQTVFQDAEGDDKEFLQLFSFISALSFDVYLKKHIVEYLIDQLRAENIPETTGKKKH